MPLPTLPVFLSSDERKLIKMLRRMGAQAELEYLKPSETVAARLYDFIQVLWRTQSTVINTCTKLWLMRENLLESMDE